MQLVLGRAGSGKTEYMLSQINKFAYNGQKCLCIVPEQFTVTAERAVISYVQNQGLKNIEVLNFRRLCDKVFKEAGLFRSSYIDEGGKYLIMALALEAVNENLKTFKDISSISFIDKLIAVANELKYYCVSPTLFEQKSRQIEDNLRKNKLCDISLIISAYNAILNEKFCDVKDDLDLLSSTLLNSNFLKEYIVFFDAFNSFSPQEYLVINEILKIAKETYFSLCCDELIDKDGGYGIFSNVKSTAIKLIDLAKKNNIENKKPISLNTSFRFINNELDFLEKNIFISNAQKYNEQSNNVIIYSAKDAFDEANFICLEISRLVRENGYKYNDFVIIGRNTEDYRGIIDTVLKRYSIPFFDDRRIKLLSKPLVLFVQNALNIACYGFETNYIISMLKTGLLNISDDDICLLENYVYKWSINKYSFTNSEKWTFNPEGYEKEISNEGQLLLDKLNYIKLGVISKIKDFCEKIKNSNAMDISIAIYDFLLCLNVRETLEKTEIEYANRGEAALAQEQKQVWDDFVKSVEQISLILKDNNITIKKYSELLNLILSNYSIGKIPTSIDEVVIGNANRIRTYNPKCVFIICANDGVFPKIYKDDGIITDSDREAMSEFDIFLAPSTANLAFEERFFVYLALSSATEKTYISYSKIGLDGKEARPSFFVGNIKRILPKCSVIDFSDITTINKCEREIPSFDLLSVIKDNSNSKNETNALINYFSKKKEFKIKLQNIIKLKDFTKNEKLFISKNIKALYGKDLKLSASRAEIFYKCKFAYFCKYGLNAKPRRKATLAALEIGSFVHNILENAIKETSKSEKKLYMLSKQEINELAKRISKKYLLDYFGKEQTPRFLYLFNRIWNSVSTLLFNLAKEFSQCGFVPSDFELSINENGDIKPLVIPLSNGGSICVNGFADRVDVFEKNNKKYIRIVDYKTGIKTFSLNDIVNGLNMQMLIYLFAIWENGQEYFKSKVMPAGILYYPANAKILTLPRNSSDEEIEKQRDKTLKMNGLLLDDVDILMAMESELEGKFIPVRAIKEGFSSKSIASLAQFSKLKNYIEKLLSKMGEEIINGNIEIDPFKDITHNSCQFCDMKTICGIEPNRGQPRHYLKIGNDDLWNLFEEVGDENVSKLD